MGDNIKPNLYKISFENVNQIEVDHDYVQWWEALSLQVLLPKSVKSPSSKLTNGLLELGIICVWKYIINIPTNYRQCYSGCYAM
jgi:hypothetical protein